MWKTIINNLSPHRFYYTSSQELSAAQEALQHELNFHQTEVFSLSNAKQRYLDLYHDNMRLKASIDELESLYQREIHTHGMYHV